MKVACLMRDHPRAYRVVAKSMCEGIRRCGDQADIYHDGWERASADVGVMYGWKHVDHIKRFPQFVYADLPFWLREKYYRFTVGGWSPESYVMQGKDSTRLESFGLKPAPWNEDGTEILIAGSKAKACRDHGLRYMEWEEYTAISLSTLFPRETIVYRPKPNDVDKRPIKGFFYDERPLMEALRKAKVVVTHHSNVAVDALLHGVPAYCNLGAAAKCSIAIKQVSNPPRLAHREQFLNDVAWLQWSVEEMKSGACWAHLKERGLIQ